MYSFVQVIIVDDQNTYCQRVSGHLSKSVNRVVPIMGEDSTMGEVPTTGEGPVIGEIPVIGENWSFDEVNGEDGKKLGDALGIDREFFCYLIMD